MTAPSPVLDWLYYQIFPGGPGREDRVVTDLLAPSVSRLEGVPEVDRWFFLRYFDERGHHIRFRVGGTVAATVQVQEWFEPAARRAIDEMADLPAAAPAALVRSPQYLADIGRHVGVHHAIYEPEVHKYGGLAGVRAAERVFQRSSELAVRVVEAGIEGPVSRGGAAVHLMVEVVDSLLPAEARAGLWRRYVQHWSGGAGARGDQVRARLAAGIDEVGDALHAAARTWRDERVDLDEDVADLVDALRASTAAAAGDVPAAVLLFHHLHLTNNRLGIRPAEEALLGTVAAQRQGVDALAASPSTG